MADTCFRFVSNGTLAAGNYATYVYMSIHNTLDSIKMLLKASYITNSFVLIRKLFDPVLVDICLVAKWKVINTGVGEMFFQIGAHPGFLLPDYDANDPVHGYLRFYDRERRETMPLVDSELEDGLRVPLNEPKTYLGEGAFPITDSTFRNNALLFEGGQVAAVDLIDKHGALVLRVDCPRAEAFGVWAPFKPGCPFVCLEPWCGICDPSDFHGTLPERKYIHRLRAGEEFGFEYGITV